MDVDRASGYRAAVESATLFERPNRGKIAVAGADRRTYLHAMLTNDIAPLEPGSGCYAAYLTPQGRMIADMRVLELGDLVLLDLDASVAPDVLQKLDQFVFSEDVKFGDLTEVFASLCVAGPAAARILATVLRAGDGQSELDEAALAGWIEFHNRRVNFEGQVVVIAASRELGVPGYDLYIEQPHEQSLVEALVAAGAARGSRDATEQLRIEAGRPTFGIDMGTDTIPLEAGIEGRAISFTKGCYPGQEIVIRVVHRGQGRVARRLAGLRVDGDVLPARGDVVRAGDREAGRVTSAANSPRAGGIIALAMLHRDFQEPGTAVAIDHGGQSLAAVISALPFVS
jgi:tRNA-modifying protein YgfZ